MKKLLHYAIAGLFLTLAPFLLKAQSDLFIDFSRLTESEVEDGWQAYIADHEVEEEFSTQNFTAFGTMIYVTPVWDESAPAEAKQMMYRDGTDETDWNYCWYDSGLKSMIIDWIGTDSRQPDTTFTLHIEGVPEGEYNWTSYHHDGNNQRGRMLVEISNNSGIIAGDGDTIHISQSAYDDEHYTSVKSLDSVTTYSATITSSGTSDLITIKFEILPILFPGNEQVNEQFIVLNGLKLEASGTSVAQLEDNSQIKIVPALVRDYFTVTAKAQDNINLVIYNSIGAVVYNTNFRNTIDINKEQVGPAGSYFVQLNYNQTSIIRKLIIL